MTGHEFTQLHTLYRVKPSIGATIMGTRVDLFIPPNFFTCGDRQGYGTTFFGSDNACDNSKCSICKVIFRHSLRGSEFISNHKAKL
jgi:hypothetical protein